MGSVYPCLSFRFGKAWVCDPDTACMPVILAGFDLTIRKVSACTRYPLFHYLLPLLLLLWPDYVVRMNECLLMESYCSSYICLSRLCLYHWWFFETVRKMFKIPAALSTVYGQIIKETHIRFHRYRSNFIVISLLNVQPGRPHFRQWKVMSTGVYLTSYFFYLIMLPWCWLEPPQWGGPDGYPGAEVWSGIGKILHFVFRKIVSLQLYSSSIHPVSLWVKGTNCML